MGEVARGREVAAREVVREEQVATSVPGEVADLQRKLVTVQVGFVFSRICF